MSKSAETKDNSVVLIEQMPNSGMAVHLDETDEHAGMLVKYFGSLRKEPVNRHDIYGETLHVLVVQLEFLSRLAGTFDFVSRTLEAQFPEEDAQLLKNIETSVTTIMDVINEKFGPRVR